MKEGAGLMHMNILDLGCCEYGQAFEVQLEILRKVQAGEAGDTLILVEHPPVITLGRNALPENVRMTPVQLEEKGIALHSTTRGGDVTYHGPGQLVGYPIFHLKARHGGSIRTFVNNLEEVFIRVLDEAWGVQAHRDACNAGVWVGQEKVVAIGLAVKQGVTMHGFAFNISPDLSHYQAIVPCGLVDRGVTSLEKLTGTKADMGQVKQLVKAAFIRQFGFEKQ